ncbi:hypothetical protein C8Q77DRAFT_13347 [Trametes polyzona]|nr:hypothetical protein C8Q77DRAFT_13347 [Trametes polyzona]
MLSVDVSWTSCTYVNTLSRLTTDTRCIPPHPSTPAMLFIALFLTSLAAIAHAVALPKRQPSTVTPSPFTGAIVTPVENQLMSFGADFPFEYDISDWCEPGYAPFTVYLTAGDAPPVFDNVTVSGGLADGAFAFEFGQFVVARFGLPQQGVPPPTTLTMPTLDKLTLDVNSETKFFLAVVEAFSGCPGHITMEYGLTSVPLSIPLSV